MWKRSRLGTIEPFDSSDLIDFVFVSVRKDDLFGQFIFPKDVLLEKGVFSTVTTEGKRAIRVYPPWDETSNKQAKKTQNWQVKYFFEITPEPDFDTFRELVN